MMKEKLLPINQFSRPGHLRTETLGIVYHWTGAAGQENDVTARWFEILGKQDANDKKPDIYASAHYIVGIDGEIIRCVPDDEVAYHVGAAKYTQAAQHLFPRYTTNEPGRTPNYCLIGIELTHPGTSGKFTGHTLRSAIGLGVDLIHTYSLPPQAIYRHYDITGKLCPKYFVEHEDLWLAFIEEIRDRL